MILQTKIPLDKETKNPISYLSKIFLLGSCFSENIGDQLNYFKFQMHQNPFGILFHPKAIENFISNVIHEKKYVAEDLIFQDEQWHSFDAHSTVSSSNKEKILEDLNLKINTTKKQFQEVSHIIITLGTSWVYTYTETNTVVANCHKIPQKKFSKKLLSIDEVSKSLEAIINVLPGMKSPTVLPLAESGWSSVHSVIDKNQFWNIIDDLKALGAQGILICPIEKMVL